MRQRCIVVNNLGYVKYKSIENTEWHYAKFFKNLSTTLSQVQCDLGITWSNNDKVKWHLNVPLGLRINTYFSDTKISLYDATNEGLHIIGVWHIFYIECEAANEYENIHDVLKFQTFWTNILSRNTLLDVAHALANVR